MGQAAGSPCGSRPSAWAEVTWMVAVSTCWMTAWLAMNSWTASWPPPSRAGATSPLVKAATSFRMWIGSGRVFDPHAISQFQQAAYEIVGQHLDAALPGPFLDGTVLRGVGEEEPGMMKTLKPGTRYTASWTAMAASQVWRVRMLLPTDYRPPLTSRANQPAPSSQTRKSNSEASEADVSSSTSASLLRWGSSLRRSGGN